MKNRYIIISLVVFLVFLGITLNHYLTQGYEIIYIEKNNITKTNKPRGRDETLLPVGYLEYDQGVGYWGYIDLDGEVAISLTYDETYFFDENYLAVVKKDEKFGLINTVETKILPIEYETIKYMGSNIYYYQDETSGHIARYDNNSDIMIKLKDVTYDEVGYFTDSLAYVTADNKLGYINLNGEVEIELLYDFYPDFDFNFYDGFAFIYQNNKFGIINKNNEVVLTPQQDEVLNDYIIQFDYQKEHFVNYDMIPYRSGDLWGYMKHDGTICIEPQFLEAYPFTDNHHARVKLTSGKYNFIFKNGHVLSTHDYVEANDFYNGYAMVSLGIGQEGMINHMGEMIINNEYDYVGTVNQGVILTIDNGHSKYHRIDNLDEFVTINYYLGDDMTDCRVVFASDEGGDDKTYVILNLQGQRVYNEITSKYYEQFYYNNGPYISLVAYEEASNLEYYTYIHKGELLWKVYKD
ncbi:WG repeat-containing protein [Mycoplasmatota bacterium]|nr:WG repeat-containing protein [Mycoplasmatota bacterium]